MSGDGADARRHVVIVGGGFAGVGCARRLDGHDGVRVTLIDRNNYHQFQPLLYQVATSQLAPSDIAYSLRKLFQKSSNVDVKLGDVASIDPATHSVTTTEGERIAGDALVLAAGSQPNFFHTPGAEEHAFPLYCLDDAQRLRSRILAVFEAADRDANLVSEGALNFVVVGGGPTGVETAGALAELYRASFSRDYPDIPQERARIILVEAGPEVFAMFKPELREYTVKALEERTVELMTGDPVASITPTRVTLKSGTELKAHTLVWGAGLQGNQLVRSLGVELERGNRLGVGPSLNLPDHPEVYVVGDIAAITDGKTKQVLPQLGSVALQSGEHAGEEIARRIAREKTREFKYHDKGTMAAIGRGSAVVQMLGGRTMKGKAAQIAWGTVHLALLPTNQDRAKAVVDWSGAVLTHQRAGRITVTTDD
jgi:NADH:quinone reductase (non-electrogenic)